jgi:RHS repeat-associated protein
MMQPAVEVSPTIPGIPGIYRYDGFASLFTAYFRDSETGNDYAINRYHQPGMGRFLSTDIGPPTPASPGSWDRYAYVQGDPVNSVDKSGLLLSAQDCIADPEACELEDGPGDPGGSPFDPEPAPPICLDPAPYVPPVPAPPPIQCSFSGAKTLPPGTYKGTTAGLGYYMPIWFNFTVTGGDGIYVFSDTQQFQETGSAVYSSSPNIPVSLNASGYESLTNTGTAVSFTPYTGSSLTTASFEDAPGQPNNDPGLGKTLAAQINWTFTLNVQVDGVSCGSVSWMASLSWPRKGKKSGSDTVGTYTPPN